MNDKESVSKELKAITRPTPGGAYQSVNIRGNIAYVAIQFPIGKEQSFFLGHLGKELSTNEGYQAARLTALNILAQIDYYVGINNIEGLNHVDIYYQKSGNWDEGPLVANGASDLFNSYLGRKGNHSRAIFGVESLPRDFCLGIVSTFTLKNSFGNLG